MKKSLLSLIVIAGCISGVTAQNVTIPDVNFKAYLVGNATINTNADTEIQLSEATAFTGTINVFDDNIADLTGIESFTALTQLNCTNNNLTSLDVSNNTMLTFLSCGENNLTTLDVSNNPDLVTLICTFNAITTLDVSYNVNLDLLWCNANQLTAIDVSMLPLITSFSCASNNLITLDVSTNPILNNLTCQNNDLTSLNVANGNNMSFAPGDFNATNCPDLTCVQVDDVMFSNAVWTSAVDAGVSFSLDCSSAAGVTNTTTTMFTLYPNPAVSEITIQSEETIESTHIFDVFGNLVQTETGSVIDIQALSSGVYFVSVKTRNGLAQQKFTKN